MAGDWTDWADGTDLANMSQGSSPLAKLGYDADALRADPLLRAAAMQRLSSPDIGQREQAPAASAPARTPTQGNEAVALAGKGPQLHQRVQQPQAGAVAAPAPQAPSADDNIPDPVLMNRNGTPATGPGGGPPLPPPASLGESAATALGGQAAAPDIPVDPNARAEQAAEAEMEMGRRAAGIYGNEPTPPDTSALDTRIERETQPTDPGKPLYREGFLGRVGRGFEGALAGLAKGGAPGAISGAVQPQVTGVAAYGAPNAEYQYEESRRQGLLARDQAEKADTLARFKALTDAANGRAGNLIKTAPLFNDAGTLANNAQRNQQAATAEAARERDASPEGKAAVATALSDAEFNQRQKQADRIFGPGKGGEMRALYLANGKVPDPKQATAEEIARSQALGTFRRQNGRMPETLEEINQVNAAASGRLKAEGGGSDNPNVSAIVADAVGKKNSFQQDWYRDDQGSYRKVGVDRSLPPVALNKGEMMTPAEMAAKLDQYRLDANTKLAKYGTQMDEHGQVVASPAAAGSSQPSNQPGGRISVSAPDGRTYHFPNKKAADDFKAAAGIK